MRYWHRGQHAENALLFMCDVSMTHDGMEECIRNELHRQGNTQITNNCLIQQN